MIRINKLIGLLFLVGWAMGEIFRLPGVLPVTLLDVAVGIAAIGSLAGWKVVAVPRSRILLRKTASLLRKFANFANSQKISLGIAVILILSWVLGLRLFSWQESIPGGLYLLRFLGYLWVIANAEKLLAPIKKFIAPALWVFVILAWAQYLFLPDTRFLLSYGWDEHYYRMIGTVLDPNYLGVMLGIIGIYLIYKYTNRQIDKWGKILLVLSFGGLAVTYSRASWMAIVVVGCWLLVISGRLKNKLRRWGGLSRRARSCFAGGFLLLILTVWLIAPKPGGEGVNLFRTNSIEQRIVSWKQGVKVWREHPLVGVGFNNYGVGKERGISHAENAPSSSWILLLATTGVIGIGWLIAIGSLAGICSFAVTLLRRLADQGWPRAAASLLRKFANFANCYNSKSLEIKNVSKLWIGVLAMVGIHAIFNNTLFYPPVLGLLALIKAASED